MTKRTSRRLIGYLFLAGVGVWSWYYGWSGLQTVRPERVAMWENATAWWSGVWGRSLSHHRPGFQVAYVNPRAARVTAVWDARVDAGEVERLVEAVPAGEWAVVTVLAPGAVDVFGDVVRRLSIPVPSGDLQPQGTLVAVLAGSPAGGPELLYHQLAGDAVLAAVLPAGLRSGDAIALDADFTIAVHE